MAVAGSATGWFGVVSADGLLFGAITGRLHRLPGVRGGSEPGDAGQDGAQAAVVLQTVRRGRERLHRPPRAAEHHQGTLNQPLAAVAQVNQSHRNNRLGLLPQAIRAINGTENQETSAEDFTNGVFDRIDINGDGE